MKILAVNPGHNGSACLVEDGNVIVYIEEERMSRMKYDGNPFLAVHEILKDHTVDYLVLAGTDNRSYPQLTWTGESLFHGLVRKYCPDVKVIDMSNLHHLGHAASAFYNSGFDKAICIVVDGSGSIVGERRGTNAFTGFETETAYIMSYDDDPDMIFKSIFSINDVKPYNDSKLSVSNNVTITKAYEAVSHYLGFGFIEAGKTMGLAPYGKENSDIPVLLDESRRVSLELMSPVYPGGALVRTDTDESKIFQSGNPESKDWHKDQKKVNQIACDLAWRVQHDTQKAVGDLIEKLVIDTDIKHICISGGYGLNCVANNYFTERFPEVTFFNDPIAHDGGTVIGLAKLVWYRESESKKKYPLTSLFLGTPQLTNINLTNDKVTENFITNNVSYSDVAKLITNNNIVAMFQNRSEAGPRALGSRSILFNPTHPNGKDIVNKVKGREWFRPFAGSMLQENFTEWFETNGYDESPFMMRALKFKPEMEEKVPSISHVDGTCRIQTVKEEQNPHYYALIKEFNKLTGVPILFNTSFNLAGDPLVETFDNALDTLLKSELKYLYIPELGVLLEKK